MPQLEQIEAIEKRLWSSADNLRANSNYASNEYFMPVMGLIFLRHAYSRYLAVKDDIEASLPKRGGKTRPLSKEDFSRKSAIFLKPESQFEYLVALPDSADRAQAIIDAMENIEADYETLRGVLPKTEYQELDNNVLGQLFRTFNDPALKTATGDIFGRIYEYFLTQFANQKAHDAGEFFTPVALVQMIVNVIEPDHGKVMDPACGSGGMFVQSAHFIEREHKNPTEQVTFYGLEKNPTTIRLAKMNLAVHGLEGNIQKAITYYEDPHDMFGKSDFVMANPPFNVDEVDAEKVKNDPRLPFGLPGVNKKEKVSNGNYLWISYFYSYLNATGRSGFVMSSQASSAGRDEAKVRQKLIQNGHVDVMIAIRSNFFYTRSVPCELWFFDKGKPTLPSPSEGERVRMRGSNTILMIDARNIYRKVTRKIYDFSPEQLKNLSAIVWLYRGQHDRFLNLVADYLDTAVQEAIKTTEPLQIFWQEFTELLTQMQPFLESLPKDAAHTETEQELQAVKTEIEQDISTYRHAIEQANSPLEGGQGGVNSPPGRGQGGVNSPLEGGQGGVTILHQTTQTIASIAEQSRELIKQIDLLYKLIVRLSDLCEKDLNAKESEIWPGREIAKAKKSLDETRKAAVEQLKQVRYFYRQAHWLQERFPEAELRDVEGLVKLVSIEEIEQNDWSLTPGRYVGVAPEEEDEDFDFEEALQDIHVELQDLNVEAQQLAETIAKNFEELGI
jgi:type I restriction enzyme M protein